MVIQGLGTAFPFRARWEYVHMGYGLGLGIRNGVLSHSLGIQGSYHSMHTRVRLLKNTDILGGFYQTPRFQGAEWSGVGVVAWAVQEYLAHKNPPPPPFKDRHRSLGMVLL